MVIHGQCSQAVLSKLASDEDCQALEENDDALGSLAKLKEMAFSTGGVRHPHMALQEVMRKLIIINQGEKEQLSRYHKRFLTATQVIEETWGPFYPVKLVADGNEDDIKQARDSMLAMIFSAGADSNRHGKLLNTLKKDEHPTSMESALTLLQNYRDHQGGGHNVKNSEDLMEKFCSTSEEDGKGLLLQMQ